MKIRHRLEMFNSGEQIFIFYWFPISVSFEVGSIFSKIFNQYLFFNNNTTQKISIILKSHINVVNTSNTNQAINKFQIQNKYILKNVKICLQVMLKKPSELWEPVEMSILIVIKVQQFYHHLRFNSYNCCPHKNATIWHDVTSSHVTIFLK